MLEINSIGNSIKSTISTQLERMGVLGTIFFRVKSAQSISKKLMRKDYLEGKLIQDLIGIRIALYFPDDILIVINMFKNLFVLDNKDIDIYNEETFRPKRLNLVFRLKDDYLTIFKESVNRQLGDKIDATFEVQIRTILSEGWHEVEHDLRYKCKEDWEEHKDLSRTLNGIYATLETSEWAMLNIFNEMSYRNYKDKNWEAMLRNKFRLKILPKSLSVKLESYLNKNNSIAKELYKCDRTKILNKLSKSKLSLPMTYDNLIYLINYLTIKDSGINELLPTFVRDEFNSYLND